MEAISNSSEKRQAKRKRVLRTGKIIFGPCDIVIDCLILDESPHGLLTETSFPSDVPEQVKIKVMGGGTFHATQRWTRGSFIGFEIIGPRIDDNATLVNLAVQSLRRARFFDNDELRSAAEQVEASIARLELLLSGRQLD